MTTRVIGPQSSVIAQGYKSQIVLPAFLIGGVITNPASPSDQGLSFIETLYVDPTGPASFFANGTTVALQPGDSYKIIPGSTRPVWVTAPTAGHRFQAYGEITASSYPPTPIPMTFPPSGPTTMTAVINSYPYKEYDDDDDVQAFFTSYNTLAQTFINTINALNLPIYTLQSGALLDWVAQGIYGVVRPALSSGQSKIVGPLNTYQFNTFQLNETKTIGPTNIVVTSDDTFKRILTWALLKGDSKVFNIRWLKRRVMRFLIGTDGTNPNIDQTYQISVTFGTDGEVAIRFVNYITSITKSAIFNRFQLNAARFNELEVEIMPLTPLPYRQIFEEAIQVGALELPFQFTYNILGYQ